MIRVALVCCIVWCSLPCRSVAQQPRRAPVPLKSFNLPKSGLLNLMPQAPEQFTNVSQWQVSTMQLVAQTNLLREETSRLAMPALVRQSLMIRANNVVQRAEAMHTAARQNNLNVMPTLRAGFNQNFGQFVQALQPYLAGNPGLRQAVAQVEFAEQQLDGNPIGGIVPGPGVGGGNQQREQSARLAYAVESQAEQLRATIQDVAGFQANANLNRQLRSFAFANRQLGQTIEQGATIQQALTTYTGLVQTWQSLVQSIQTLYGNQAAIQNQAARTNSLMADLGRVLNGQDWIIPPGPGLLPPGQRILAVGAGQTGGPHVKLCSDLNAPSHDFFAYDVNFRGGVRVAVADLNGDGIPDLVTAPGRGMIPLIRVFDGRDLRLIAQFVAYDAPYDLGVYVAAADYSANGRAMIAVGPGEGGPPHVKLFDLIEGRMIDEIYPYPRELRCGVRVALGDINRDGLPELVTVPGPGNGPHVRIFNGADGQLLREFNAVEDSFRGGLFPALADVTRNGRSDLIIGTDSGRIGQVNIYDPLVGRLLGTMQPYGRNYRQGVRVSSYDVDNDGIPDIVTAPGAGAALPVRIYSGVNQRPLFEFTPYQGNFRGGIFVSGK